ncbi:hypothetical protein SETIT_1G018600v2 [Setaria italica]|uniref:DUF2921 domain-containing protein n=2 Tax=Setaria italica TaxID=4555 RepID=A0A368PG68_SETIT|nr:hypothetical protein SETIT_1G018600v2 [Setaria italica]
MEAASSKIFPSLLLNLAFLFLPCLSAAVSSNQSFQASMSKGPIHRDKSVFADERHCQPVLSSAAELRYGADSDGSLKYRISFINGDWSQDAGQAPLLPSHGSSADAAAAGPELPEAVPLASFMLLEMSDMVPRRGARTALNASGVLSLTITRNNGSSHMELQASPEFQLLPGVARLLIHFQGVYTETKSSGSGDDGSGGGERVLCMVGDTVLPVCDSNCTDLWEWTKNRGSGNILLVLRYPKAATLTTRAVRGEMRSTSAKSDAAYFDTVRLVSQLALGYGSDYRFQPEDAELDTVAVAGCSDDPLFHDGDAMDMESLNSGASLCDVIYQSGPDRLNLVMEVIPNRDCKGTDAFCSRVGPFETTGRPGTSATEDTAFTRSATVAMQGLKCEWTSSVGGTAAAARVAAVFRYVPPWEHQPTAAWRTGLSGATLSSEGVWNASTGRACMVGCLGVGEEACRYRVTLSVRTAFSMTRRGFLVGRMTAMDGSHAPLSFQQRVDPRFGRYGASPASLRMSYSYTIVEQARELLLRRSVPSGFRDSFVAKSLLSYPNIAGDVDDMVSLSNLADNLGLRFQCVGKLPFVPEWIEEPCFELEILSVGTLVGSYSPQFQGSRSSTWIELLRRVRAVENQQILNVSAGFTASRNLLSPIPVMSVEGVYNPVDGRMYLIGCRNVHAPWRVLSERRDDLEDGMDCSIEVTVEYPPTTTRWLPIGQTAKVSVASTREEDDPLHFARSELRTVPVVYRDQPWDELVKPVLEGILCITVLSVARIVFVPVAFFQLFG